MKNITEYIESGILELYVLGMTNTEESAEVENMALQHPEVKQELAEIQAALEFQAKAHGKTPSPTIKPFLMAMIDYSERLQNGEAVSFPPAITSNSSIDHYAEWLSRSDMGISGDFEEFEAKIIGHTPEMTTAIVWIKHMAPHEVHDDEYEKFLVVEGTCDIFIEDTVHQLVPGDSLSIPLHKSHYVQVTSANPCKVILQRIAA